MSDEAVPKLTVSAAALAFGIPERSLFRAVEKGHIPSSKRDSVTVIDPADVEAWVNRRAAAQAATATATAASASQNAPTAAVNAGSLPAAHGGLAVGSGRGAPRPILDGELTSALIGAFKRDEAPVDVAEAFRLPIPIVLEAYEQYQRAKSATAPSPHQARLDAVEMQVGIANADTTSLMETVGRLQREFAALSIRIANLPVPERDAFKCSCGNTGWAAVPVKCTACGRRSEWGFHPPKQEL